MIGRRLAPAAAVAGRGPHVGSGGEMIGQVRAGRPRGVVFGLLLAALTAAPAALADVGTPILSGLSWRSGSTGGGFPCLAQLRSRPLDAGTTFITHDSFSAMVRQTAGAWTRGTATRAP